MRAMNTSLGSFDVLDNDIISRARQFVAGSHSLPSMPTMSFAPTSSSLQAAAEFYKDKYIQGMEERLALHAQNAAKDAEIREKEQALLQVLQYIRTLEQELAGELTSQSTATSQAFQLPNSPSLPNLNPMSEIERMRMSEGLINGSSHSTETNSIIVFIILCNTRKRI